MATESPIGIPGAQTTSAPVIGIRAVTTIDPATGLPQSAQGVALVDETSIEYKAMSEVTGREILRTLQDIVGLLRDGFGLPMLRRNIKR